MNSQIRVEGNERLLRTCDAAGLLGIREKTLQLWRREGKGPTYIRVGPRLVRYRLSDLATWLSGRTSMSAR